MNHHRETFKCDSVLPRAGYTLFIKASCVASAVGREQRVYLLKHGGRDDGREMKTTVFVMNLKAAALQRELLYLETLCQSRP